MLNIHCPQCGARYRIPPEKKGKHAKCVKCGERFLIEPPPEPPPELELEALATGDTLESARAAVPAVPGAVPGIAGAPPSDDSADDAPPPLGPAIAAYLKDVAETIPMLLRPRNLITILVIWVIYMLQLIAMFGCCLTPAVVIAVTGYYLSYLLNVVVDGAAREEDLPSPTFVSGWVDDILAPLAKFVAVTVVTLVPMGSALLWAVLAGGLDGLEALVAFGYALRFDYSALLALDPHILVTVMPLLIFGQAMQPMLLLCVAVGGLNTLLRWDLMTRTILRTLPAYIILLVVFWAMHWLPALVTALVVTPAATPANAASALSTMLANSAVSFAVDVVISIFTMRAIGLYYHHFKQRFAWSWG